MECETLSDAAVAAAAGVPNSTLAAWVRRGHLARPAAGWRVEDAVALRVAWLLTSSGMPPDVALRLCDQNRRAIWRCAGWLLAIRRHAGFVGGNGSEVRAEVLALDRREDLVQVLTRLTDVGADLAEVHLLDLGLVAQKTRLGLAHYLSTRRPRGRPRKNKEDDK
jgi:hypothetical protein